MLKLFDISLIKMTKILDGRFYYEELNFNSIIKNFPINLIWQNYKMGVNMADWICENHNHNNGCEAQNTINTTNYITSLRDKNEVRKNYLYLIQNDNKFS